MAHPQTPEFMRKIGKLGGRPKGSKNKATLDKEEARRIYLERLSRDWEQLSDIHVEEAKKPNNFNERREAIHQFIGKPVEKMEVEQTTILKVDV